MSRPFASKKERYEVGKHLVLILRELAHSLALDVDEYGWVSIEAVLKEMKVLYPWIDSTHITEVVEKDAQKRFEISGNRIRAKAGHRYDVSVPSPPIEPPEFLYHGTTYEASKQISVSGIKRMGKAYVHLTTTVERARRIGRRKTEQPVILRIDARRAFEDGVRFWRSGQASPDGEIILSDEIPPVYVAEISD